MAKTATVDSPAPAKKVRKPEVVAIARIGEILDGLTPSARGRVLRWATEAYAEPAVHVPDPNDAPVDLLKPA